MIVIQDHEVQIAVIRGNEAIHSPHLSPHICPIKHTQPCLEQNLHCHLPQRARADGDEGVAMILSISMEYLALRVFMVW